MSEAKMDNYEIYRQFSVKSRLAYSLVCLDLLYDKYLILKEAKEYKYITNILWIFIEMDIYNFDFFHIFSDIFMEFSYNYIIIHPVKDEKTNQWRRFISEDEERRSIEHAKSYIKGYIYEIPLLENKMDTLEKYYLSLPDAVADVYEYMDELWERGFDSGGDGEDDSSNTLFLLEEIIETLKIENIALPPTEPFLFSKFSVYYGLGCPVPKCRIEEALGRKL